MEAALIGAVALFCFGMGVVGLASPARIRAYFTAEPLNALERNEFRAVYGGFGIALAMGLVWAASSHGELARGFVLACGVGFGGMAAGRFGSLLWEPQQRFFPSWAFLLLEISLASALLLSLA